MAHEIILLGTYFSGFSVRVRIALAEKGIEYEYSEESLDDKSSLLLEMNPVHKKIPVLIHNGKPICESLIILQYIDETWKDKSPKLLPPDPHQRAQARFWADFIDKKVYDSGRAILLGKGEELETAKKDILEALKLLERVLGDKPYWGGDSLGFLDIALIPYYSWFYSYEVLGNFSIEEHCPKLLAWCRRCAEHDSVSKSLSDPKRTHDYALGLRKRFGVE